MSICPVKLKEVLHDFAEAMATLFNIGDKVLDEAKAKIEAIFEEASSTEEAPVPAIASIAAPASDTAESIPAISTEEAPAVVDSTVETVESPGATASLTEVATSAPTVAEEPKA